MTSPRSLAVAALMASAVAVSACSSSKPATEPTPSKSASRTAPARGTPLKVGLICSCSGALGATELVAEEVYKAWAKSVNLAGGIAGHTVQLITEDDAANPGNSISDIQTFISNHVAAIVDVSLVDSTWASTVEGAKIPVVGGNLTEPTFYTNPDFFPEGTTEDAEPVETASIAKDAGASNVGYLYCAEAAVCAQTGDLLSKTLGNYGARLVYKASIAISAPDYTAQCVAARQAGATSLDNGDADAVFERVATDCNRQGYHPIYLSSGNSYDPSMPTSVGIMDNSWYSSSDLPFFVSNPAITAMNAAMNKYYPGVVGKAQLWTGVSSDQVWASGLLLADAVKAGGLKATATPSAAEITNGLAALKDDTLDGLAPPLTFVLGKAHPVDCWFTFRLKDGTPLMANDGKVSCESAAAS